jgi:hypothetical protein
MAFTHIGHVHLEAILNERLRRVREAIEATPQVLASEGIVMLNAQLDAGYGGDVALKPLTQRYARREKSGDTTPDLRLRGQLRGALRVKSRKGGASIVFRSGSHHGGLSIAGLADVQSRDRDFMRLNQVNKNRLIERAGREITVRNSAPIQGRLTINIRF